MHLTRVFVSSTCFDLSAVRESLRSHLKTLGHDPILSDFPSFPVRPDESTISNCLLNVKDCCDLLVLIVGGRRGYLDPETGKSVTNLEFSEAKAAGKPCFVFVNRTVLDLLPLWKKNPSADFTPHVDYPQVFNFVEEIREDNQWTFPFTRTEDIEETLSIQLSGLMRILLERQRSGTIDPIARFSEESVLARKLVRDKPECWEFKLSAELLRDKLARVRQKYEKAKTGHLFVPARSMPGQEFFTWVGDQFANAILLVDSLGLEMGNYSQCWGPPGISGDAINILEATNSLVGFAGQVIEWECSIRAIRTHEVFDKLRSQLSGVLEGILAEMEKIPRELLAPFSDGKIPPDGTVISINLTLSPPDLEGYNEELQRLQSLMRRNPSLFADI